MTCLLNSGHVERHTLEISAFRKTKMNGVVCSSIKLGKPQTLPMGVLKSQENTSLKIVPRNDA